MNIGFIGCGNMATAIIKGITKAQIVKGEEIFVFDKDPAKLDNAVAKYGVTKCKNANVVTQISDYVILAVKPNVITSVLNEINIALEESNTTIISIAAGKTIDFIRDSLSHKNKIIRIMPNINAMVGEACSAYCANEYVTEAEKTDVEKIFGSIGSIMELDEKDFPLFGVIAGCSPAFAYMYIDELARAGVKYGMKKDDALKIAAQSVLGSAKMILQGDAHPYELIDRVCSPGGTTIEGVLSLQKDGFANAIHNAIDKAIDKDSKL